MTAPPPDPATTDAHAAEPEAYFMRVSCRTYRPTQHTAGAWSTTEQHISPLHGLVVHAIETFVARRATDHTNGPTGPSPDGDGKVISRLAFEILGPVAIDDFDIDVDVIRSGRTVELLEATVTSASREVLRARAWRLSHFDTGTVAGGQPAPIPPARDLDEWPITSTWPGGYIASLVVRRTADSAPGRATAWLSTRVELLAGEAVSPLARFVALVDTANGIGVRERPDVWSFPNVDLTIHLYRQPGPGPVGLDTTVVFGAHGQGLTTSVLHDEQGPVGQAAQMLTIRLRPQRA